jgi:excisionase family DNA binding protein
VHTEGEEEDAEGVSDRLELSVPESLVERIAERAAALVLARLQEAADGAASRYVTVEQAAALYQCKPQRIYELLSSGRLTRIKEGGRVLLLRSELEGRLERDERVVNG